MNNKLTASLGLLSSATLLVAYLHERKNNAILMETIGIHRNVNATLYTVAETVLEVLDGKYETEEDAVAVLGKENVRVVKIEGAHDVPVVNCRDCVDTMSEFWANSSV